MSGADLNPFNLKSLCYTDFKLISINTEFVLEQRVGFESLRPDQDEIEIERDALAAASASVF